MKDSFSKATALSTIAATQVMARPRGGIGKSWIARQPHTIRQQEGPYLDARVIHSYIYAFIIYMHLL